MRSLPASLLIILFLVVSLPVNNSCTRELEDKIFGNELDKMLGNTPKPVEDEPSDLELKIVVRVRRVAKMPSGSTDFVPAYPQSITLHTYRKTKGTTLDIKDVEKWTEKDGITSFKVLFRRLYPDDIVCYSYKPSLFVMSYASSVPQWKEKTEYQLTTKTRFHYDQVMYDKDKNIMSVSLYEELWLPPFPSPTSPKK